MREACSTCRRSSNSHVCRECVLASRPSIEFQLQFDAQNVSSLVALELFDLRTQMCTLAGCAARRAHRHGTARAVAAVASRDTATSDDMRHQLCVMPVDAGARRVAVGSGREMSRVPRRVAQCEISRANQDGHTAPKMTNVTVTPQTPGGGIANCLPSTKGMSCCSMGGSVSRGSVASPKQAKTTKMIANGPAFSSDSSAGARHSSSSSPALRRG